VGGAARRQLGGGPEERIGDLTKEERLENLRYWKSTVGYGRRWIVEIVISALKRMFSETSRDPASSDYVRFHGFS